MSTKNISAFFKENKADAAHVYIPASDSFMDEDGDVIDWEVRPITTAENEKLVKSCTKRRPITGKPGQYTDDFDGGLYTKKLCVACTVFPDLYDADLQDSYGVTNPEDLLLCLLDRPGEYMRYGERVSDVCGFGDNSDATELIDEAKNS